MYMNNDKKKNPSHAGKQKEEENETCSELNAIDIIKPRENNQEIHLLEKDLDDNNPDEKELPPCEEDQ
jgi:hypothetical protein